jgi:hypothetical protein
MPADVHTIPAGNGKGKTRLLTRDALDGRTKARKRFDAIANGIMSDLGGSDRVSTVELHLIEAFAGAAVHVHDLNARLLAGEKIDFTQHATAISSLVRIAARIGVQRRPRDVTPDLQSYLRNRADAVVDAEDEMESAS